MAVERPPRAAVTPEAELLCVSCRRRIEPARTERVRMAAAAVRDWPAVVKGAVAHAIVPAVHRQLAEAACAPEEIEREMGRLARGIALRNVALTRALVMALRRLAAAGVRAMPIKGPALAITAYGDLAFRQFNDLDVVVPRDHLTTAIETLAADGWRTGVRLDAGQEAALFGADYHAVLVNDAEGCTLELHWTLERPHASANFDAEWCWAHVRKVQLGGLGAETLAPEGAVLYLCAHGAKHLWCQLRWVCDLAEVAESAPIDWGCVMREARALHVQRMLSLGLRLAHRLCDAAMPRSVLAELSYDDVVGDLEVEAEARIARADGLPTTAETATIVGYQWRARDRARDRARFAADLLFSPQLPDVAAVRLPAGMRLAYYGLRPARLAVKLLRQLAR